MLDDYVRHLAEKGIVDRFDALSEREREVFQLIAEGHSNKEIADLLSVSPATVETHRAHILQKLDMHSTAELVLYAVRRGVISLAKAPSAPHRIVGDRDPDRISDSRHASGRCAAMSKLGVMIVSGYGGSRRGHTS